MYIKLSSRDLNPDSYSSHPISTNTYKMTIMPSHQGCVVVAKLQFNMGLV